jgi:hypothetical protein
MEGQANPLVQLAHKAPLSNHSPGPTSLQKESCLKLTGLPLKDLDILAFIRRVVLVILLALILQLLQVPSDYYTARPRQPLHKVQS